MTIPSHCILQVRESGLDKLIITIIVTLPTLCQKVVHRQDKTPLLPESCTQPKERWGEGELGHQGSGL